MGSMSLVHWMIILVVVLLLFGAGRLSNVMGEFAKGIKAFRAGMREEDEPANATTQPRPLTAAPPPPPLQQSTTGTAEPHATTGERKVG